MSSVTAVGGTINVPEVAVFFSGGGFSDVVSSIVDGAIFSAIKTCDYSVSSSGISRRCGEKFPTQSTRGDLRRIVQSVSVSPI